MAYTAIPMARKPASPPDGHAITLDATDEARGWIADKGYDPVYGARPLRRLIQNEIEDTLSDGILTGQFKLGSVVRITSTATEDEHLHLETVDDDLEQATADAPETEAG